MTFRERVAIEHPEAIDNKYDGGVKGCPYHYGYKLSVSDCCTICSRCWDMEAPPRKVKPRRKKNDLQRKGDD